MHHNLSAGFQTWDKMLRCLFNIPKQSLATIFSQHPSVPTCSRLLLAGHTYTHKHTHQYTHIHKQSSGAEAGRPGQPALQSEFQDSQDYTEKLCFEKKQNKQTNKTKQKSGLQKYMPRGVIAFDFYK